MSSGGQFQMSLDTATKAHVLEIQVEHVRLSRAAPCVAETLWRHVEYLGNLVVPQEWPIRCRQRLVKRFYRINRCSPHVCSIRSTVDPAPT